MSADKKTQSSLSKKQGLRAFREILDTKNELVCNNNFISNKDNVQHHIDSLKRQTPKVSEDVSVSLWSQFAGVETIPQQCLLSDDNSGSGGQRAGRLHWGLNKHLVGTGGRTEALAMAVGVPWVKIRVSATAEHAGEIKRLSSEVTLLSSRGCSYSAWEKDVFALEEEKCV